MNEHVFLHRASSSLIVSDLVFNIRSGASAMMSIVLWINGEGDARASMRRALGWMGRGSDAHPRLSAVV